MITVGRQGTARRLAAALAATALAGLGLLAVPAAPAAAADPCVGVVVDARLLGGGVSTGCAQGDPDSGLEALTKAGYSYAFVPRQPGLVCQINGDPECSRTSTDTYWSYWYRAKGSSTWVYANQGAAGHDPAPGSTEAWVWQDGGRRPPPDIALRTICPQVASAPAPTKSTSPTPDRTRSATRSPSPRQSSSSPRGDGAAASGRTSDKPSSSATTSAAPTSTTAGPTTASPSSSPPSAAPTTAASRATEDDGSGGPPWVGVAIGGGLIAVLGGSALARSRRSGSAGGGP